MTAPDYIALRGFVTVERSAAPARVRTSVPFAPACPQSAAVMVKELQPLVLPVDWTPATARAIPA